jgi:hypothetical protein
MLKALPNNEQIKQWTAENKAYARTLNRATYIESRVTSLSEFGRLFTLGSNFENFLK